METSKVRVNGNTIVSHQDRTCLTLKKLVVLFLSFLPDLPSVTITGGTSVKTVPVGGSLTLECLGTGIPKPEIQWSRLGGPLPEGIVTEGGLLVITNARHLHGGEYVCNVTNRVGSVQSEVAIFVQGSCLNT